jgi:3D (Asp-Asp-Asp) domain-containing protein
VGAIAVDPTVIPYGTEMFIVSNDGKFIYGYAVAEDCGSSIKGNRIDLYYDSVEECNRFGIRDCTVYFLN